MALGCTLTTVKFLLLVTNLFTLLCGISLAIAGTVMHVRYSTINGLYAEQNSLLAYEALLAVSLGMIAFVISFFGFFGAARNSPCMISTYAFLLLVLMVIQIGFAVGSFLQYDKARVYFLGRVEANFDRIFRSAGANLRSNPQIARVQRLFQCCGKHSYTEWGRWLPESCCEAGAKPDTGCKPYETGCVEQLENYFTSAARTFGWLLICFTAIEFVAALSACCLANGLRDEEAARKRVRFQRGPVPPQNQGMVNP
uniref:Tetraspanin n=1 Tax=Culex tarsalis TaxID=7177 RepID=A0A1Q3FTG2_CULTA